MKNLLYLLLLFNISLVAGELNIPKVKVVINIAENNNKTESWGNQSKKGFITGVLYSIDTAKFIGSAEVSDFNFLENFSKAYLYLKNRPVVNADNDLDTALYSPNDPFRKNFNNADKIVQYSFYPEKVLPGDTLLNIYRKYILYEKTKEISANKINYDVSFYERFYTVPLNKKTSLDFLRELFPNATANEISFCLDKTVSNEEQPSLNLSDYKLSLSDIKESLEKDQAADLNMHLNVEYIRINKKGDKIFVRSKFKCPSETDRVYPGPESIQGLQLKLYKGSVTLPFQIYNPLKEQLYAKSKKYGDSKLIYSVFAIPLDKREKKYIFNLIIERSVWEGSFTYSKKIELEVGKPLRIDLESTGRLSRNDEIIDGQVLSLDTKEDFSDYVNEYFILTINSN